MSIINTSKLIEDNTELITMFDAASKDLINILSKLKEISDKIKKINIKNRNNFKKNHTQDEIDIYNKYLYIHYWFNELMVKPTAQQEEHIKKNIANVLGGVSNILCYYKNVNFTNKIFSDLYFNSEKMSEKEINEYLKDKLIYPLNNYETFIANQISFGLLLYDISELYTWNIFNKEEEPLDIEHFLNEINESVKKSILPPIINNFYEKISDNKIIEDIIEFFKDALEKSEYMVSSIECGGRKIFNNTNTIIKNTTLH